MTTIIDVAKKANVSKSTVSRVLSGNGYVHAETRKKVLDAMNILDYVPNDVARNPQSGSTKTIGFIVHGYFDLLGIALDSFMKIAKTHGYYVTLFFTDGDKQKELDALDQLKYKQLDGVFIFTRANDWETIEPYTFFGPIATWHRLAGNQRIYSAYVDHYSGYYRSLNYLYERGYRKIGHVLSAKKNLNTKARVRAIEDFYSSKNLSLNNEWIFYHSPLEVGYSCAANYWHEQADKPEAMAFYSDSAAANFISTLQNLGHRIPEEVAIIGFDNSAISRLMHITTVDYSLNYQAENSFIYLYNQLNKKQLTNHQLTVQLVERDTVPILATKK